MSKGGSVLVVEDDPIFGGVLKKYLETSYSNVECVESAERGSNFVSANKPSIIFLDNILPNLNGVEVIDVYKELSPKSIIIFMSSKLDVDQISQAIDEGADYVFDKNEFSHAEYETLMIGIQKSVDEKNSLWRYFDVFKGKEVSKSVKNIAVVEDDELFSYFISWILNKSHNNHIVNTFMTAKKFQEYTKNSKPDVVFLDYHLPDANGEDILLQIKKDMPKTKVVMLSSQEDPKIAIKLKAIGIENYIVKGKNWKNNMREVMEKLGI